MLYFAAQNIFTSGPPLNHHADYYSEKITALDNAIAWRRRSSGFIGLGRGLLFLLTGLCAIGSLTEVFTGAWAYIVPAIPFVGLIVLAAYHETVLFRQNLDLIRRKINKNQLSRIDRDWEALSQARVDVPDDRFHLSKDLDLFGKASLFKILNIAQTPLGVRTLANWVLDPAEPDEILERQAAVADLKNCAELREELQLLSQSVSEAQTDPDELLEWANGDLWLEKRAWLKWLSVVSAIAMALVIATFLIPNSPKMILGGIGIVLFAINFLITVIFSGSIHKIFNSVGYRQRDVSIYVDLFRLSKKLNANSKMLKEIQESLSTGRLNAVSGARNLQTIIGLAQMRRSGMLFLPYVILQFFFLIDCHTLTWLESWHKRYASRVGDWLNGLARFESLASLSNLAFHQPDWVYPKVESTATFSASQIGHPLLRDNDRVRNDVTVGPQQTILLVTGSNMSGKSTLLRSIGLNAVLAQAGSVVCASELRMPPVQIETSMRIGDSVSDGISFFMAELKRLRQVTIEAENLRTNKNRTLLYLLDEILQGTNSRERQIAVISVCQHLLDANAIGAISTHDLELAEADAIANKCETVHFREFFDEGKDGKKEMSFDYIMRQGVSPTTNALKLLEMVGLSKPKSN